MWHAPLPSLLHRHARAVVWRASRRQPNGTLRHTAAWRHGGAGTHTPEHVAILASKLTQGHVRALWVLQAGQVAVRRSGGARRASPQRAQRRAGWCAGRPCATRDATAERRPCGVASGPQQPQRGTNARQQRTRNRYSHHDRLPTAPACAPAQQQQRRHCLLFSILSKQRGLVKRPKSWRFVARLRYGRRAPHSLRTHTHLHGQLRCRVHGELHWLSYTAPQAKHAAGVWPARVCASVPLLTAPAHLPHGLTSGHTGMPRCSVRATERGLVWGALQQPQRRLGRTRT